MNNDNEPKTIVLIEDDQFLAKVCNDYLLETGYHVVMANHGDDAVDIVEEHQPDMILLDLILPGRNGFEILEEIRLHEEIYDTNVIILSNLSQPEDISRAKKLGVIEFFIKANTQLRTVVEHVNKVL